MPENPTRKTLLGSISSMSTESKRSSRPWWDRWYLLGIVGGTSLGLAWQDPISYSAAIFGWTAACLLILCVRSSRPHLSCYLYGLVFHPFGFYWLTHTISHFGHFPAGPTALLFSLFVFLSSLQFIIFSIIFHSLPKWCTSLALSGAIAWSTAEFISIRIFPWEMGHTQLILRPLIQIADLAGSIAISFLLFWVAQGVLSRSLKRFALPTIALGCSLLYGIVQIPLFSPESASHTLGKPVQVSLVQGNISLDQKHSRAAFRKNVQSYYELSKPLAEKSDLIIWPETAMMEWVRADLKDAKLDPRIPYFSEQSSLLFGALTFEDETKMYNSIMAVLPDGSMLAPYHKRILMPFGEFTPLGDTFPWLREMNQGAQDFSQGLGPSVYPIPLLDGGSVNVSPLICYEDIVPSLARAATSAGAEILINNTNDAWFGESAAPYQHHALAVLRAVENRRYLLRATNTGLTAVVDPTGKTTSHLKPFTKDAISTTVYATSRSTMYTTLIGDIPWWILVLFSACAITYQKAIKKRHNLAFFKF